MIELTAAASAFVTLFVIVDPLGLAPPFIALTRGMDEGRRRAVARRACLVAAILMALFGVAGQRLLEVVGISMPAFRIAGGLLLFVTAFDMLFERRTQRREGQVGEEGDDPSVFPLATPLIAGPGSLATMVLLTSEPGRGWGWTATVIALMLAVVALCFLVALSSGLFARLLGRTGILVVTRLLGMLLAALSVQFVIDGIRQAGLIG